MVQFFSVIILVTNKLDFRFTVVWFFFFNNLHDYRLNWTLISPITFIITEQKLLSNYFDMMHKLS